jgi:hypothetical protein
VLASSDTFILIATFSLFIRRKLFQGPAYILREYFNEA